MRPALIPLVKARALIADPAKWGRGMRTGTPGRSLETYCAAEAIEECGNPINPARKESFRLLREAAGVRDIGGALTDWNDDPERTHTEVLAAFDKAIEAAS